MRISDWSSDVCSSDLLRRVRFPVPFEVTGLVERHITPLKIADKLLITRVQSQVALKVVAKGERSAKFRMPAQIRPLQQNTTTTTNTNNQANTHEIGRASSGERETRHAKRQEIH